MPGRIGHIWLPNFYSSVEIKINEFSPHDAVFAVIKGQKVLDISITARGKGIKPGMTLRQARLVCPDISVIEYTPQRYTGFAEKIWEAYATYSSAVEPLNESEAFIDLSHCPSMFGALDEISKYVESIIGVSPLYGIARCKLVSRIISGILPGSRTKSFRHLTERMVSCEGRHIGANIVTDREKEFLAPLPVNMLWPLDPDILSYLLRLGIGCIGEIQRMNQSVLVDMFGQVGYVIHQYSLGMDYTKVLPVFPQNGVTFSKTFDSPVSNEKILLAVANEGLSSLEKKLDAAYMTVKGLKIALECDSGSIISRKKNLTKQVSMYGGLQRICECLLNETFEGGDLNEPVRTVSITAYGLIPVKTSLQVDMFAPYEVQASAEVMDEILCKVRERFGPGAIFPGRELQLARRDKLLLVSEGYIHEEGKRVASCYSG